MRAITFTSISVAIVLSGCAAANVSTQSRESGEPGSNKQTRCTNITTGDEAGTNAVLSKYDGWKAVYISEYTTPNKASTAAFMCFEKPIN